MKSTDRRQIMGTIMPEQVEKRMVAFQNVLLEVPLQFERDDLERTYGEIPETITVDRIFAYDSRLRAEEVISEYPFDVVETVLFGDYWVAYRPDNPRLDGEPGETLWRRSESVVEE